MYKSLSLCIITVVLAAPLPATASGGSWSPQTAAAPVDVAAIYADGVQSVADKQWKAAINKFRRVLAESPHNADALTYLGYASRKNGNQKDSLKYYFKALKEQPNHPGANSYLGELYLEMQNVPKAEERLAVLKACCAALAPTAVLKTSIEAVKAGKAFEPKVPNLSY